MILEHMVPSERAVLLLVSKRICNVLMKLGIERVRYMIGQIVDDSTKNKKFNSSVYLYQKGKILTLKIDDTIAKLETV